MLKNEAIKISLKCFYLMSHSPVIIKNIKNNKGWYAYVYMEKRV